MLQVDEDDQGSSNLLQGLTGWMKGKGESLQGEGLVKHVGSATECALLHFLVELGTYATHSSSCPNVDQ